jgi:hypothetical protein
MIKSLKEEINLYKGMCEGWSAFEEYTETDEDAI